MRTLFFILLATSKVNLFLPLLTTVHAQHHYFYQRHQQQPNKYPIILVAGYMGSQLQYSLQLADTGPSYCPKYTASERTLWLNVVNSAPVYKRCWYHYIRRHYNPRTRRTFNPRGVRVRVPDFGRTEPVEHIAPFPQHVRITSYFVKLVKELETLGYRKNFDIRGAPYDWRLAPHEQEEFFVNLKNLVEQTYYLNGYKPVIFFTHSMGGNFAYFFLRRQSFLWKKTFIKAIVFAATPWGGNFKYMYDYLYSDDFAGDIMPTFREAERTFSSLAFLLPNPRVFGNGVFIRTPSQNFTAYDMREFFQILKRPEAYQMWLDTKSLLDPFDHPEVDIYCIGGLGIPTLRGLIYLDDQFQRRRVIYSNGDGFVNLESLRGCLNWSNDKRHRFFFNVLPDSHLGMLRNQPSVHYFAKLIFHINNNT